MTLLTLYHKYIMMSNQLEVHTMSNHKRTESKHIMDDGTRQDAPSTLTLVLIAMALTVGVLLS